NLIARHLLLSLAPDFPQRPATLAAAQARVRAWLDGHGLDAQGLALDSGSGLSRADRGSARALVALLRGAALGPMAQELFASLPVAGVDGTLEHRLRGGAAQGQAWLKTGTLLDARSLAGYVRNRRGQLIAVALICNDAQAAQATPALDACIEWLARRA
ncbi:MAG TPA: D-alanyl-D-alanine carboxypeptidase, partial [Burkholderiaceae bacterium]|nr:D-alanyl-D-alanine carboxypeptidase [Burkholderiaceae bacterium]